MPYRWIYYMIPWYLWDSGPGFQPGRRCRDEPILKLPAVRRPSETLGSSRMRIAMTQLPGRIPFKGSHGSTHVSHGSLDVMTHFSSFEMPSKYMEPIVHVEHLHGLVPHMYVHCPNSTTVSVGVFHMNGNRITVVMIGYWKSMISPLISHESIHHFDG